MTGEFFIFTFLQEVYMTATEALELENSMWKAAQNRDAEAFLKVVSADAVMVCCGYRCTGR